jgi:hypothetical protein
MPLVNAEIVPTSEAAIVPAAPSANLKVVIESMVRKRVDEILSASGIGEFEPNFRPKEIAQAARQNQDMFERVKWSLYFEKWGCQVCEKKSAAHMHTGHCGTCVNRIQSRLKQLKREYERAHPDAEIERQIDRLTSRSRTAEALLGDREK